MKMGDVVMIITTMQEYEQSTLKTIESLRAANLENQRCFDIAQKCADNLRAAKENLKQSGIEVDKAYVAMMKEIQCTGIRLHEAEVKPA